MAKQHEGSVFNNLGWPEIDAISNVEVLPENILLHINRRGTLRRFVLKCLDDQQVDRLWQSLLLTFTTGSTFKTHRIAACNAISLFLDGALSSENEATRDLSKSHKIWSALFEVSLDTFEDASSSANRQIISILSKILVQNTDRNEIDRIQCSVVNATMPSILLAESKSRLKTSLIAMSILVQKRAISIQQLISRLQAWITSNYHTWRSHYDSYLRKLGVNIANLNALSTADSLDKDMKVVLLHTLNLAIVISARNSECTACSGSLMNLIFEQSVQEAFLDHELVSISWVSPVRHAISENIDRLESLSNHILYPLFQADPYGFRLLLDQLSVNQLISGDLKSIIPIDDLRLLFSALHTGKELALVHEDFFFEKGKTTNINGDSHIILDSTIIGEFLFHHEFSIRFSALSLLITSSSPNKPLSSTTLTAIARALPTLYADADAHARGETLSLIRKFLLRLNRAQSSRHHADPSSSTAVTHFINDYIAFLKNQLIPSASYPLHFMSLKSLLFIVDTGVDPLVNNSSSRLGKSELAPWTFSIQIFSIDLSRLLVDLLLDPFEDIRSMSSSLLSLFPVDIPSPQNSLTSPNPIRISQYFLEALRRAEILASNTSRADHTDTVARLYGELFACTLSESGQSENLSWSDTRYGVVDAILKKLEVKLSTQGSLFTSTFRDAPLHGYVSALRLIIDQYPFYSLVFRTPQLSMEAWRDFHSRILNVCQNIWLEVKSVLCVDSPEGHTDEAMNDLDVGPKDVLSYSWRALRESSLLLNATIANISYSPEGNRGGLNKEDFESIGSLTFTQLSELRHRGAFSTVSQTFSSLCRRCAQSEVESIMELPEQWYQQARDLIWEKSSKLTRRSAGLPALITGIFWSNHGGSTFQLGMAELQNIAMIPATQTKEFSGLTLPQVHAMNCLKDVFIDTRIAAHTEKYIMPALQIAATSLGSPIWSVRNCGLMLFRALMSRMCRSRTGSTFGFGGLSGSDSGHRIPFQKYPGLLELLTDLLSPVDQKFMSPNEQTSVMTERVFPALQLISEKISSVFDHNYELRNLVHRQFTSPIWGIREHAARVYSSLLPLSTILESMRVLMVHTSQSTVENLLHGTLMCTRFSLQRMWYSTQDCWEDNFESILSFIEEVISGVRWTTTSPFIQATVIDIYNDALECSIKYQKREHVISFMEKAVLAQKFQASLRASLRAPKDITGPSLLMDDTSRAVPLLRRTLFWSEFLQAYLRGSSIYSLLPDFHELCVLDADTASWFLHHLRLRLQDYGQQQNEIMKFHITIINQEPRYDVLTAAMLNLSLILETIIDLGEDYPREFKGSVVDVHELRELLTFLMSSVVLANREMVESNLRLQGCLLAIDTQIREEDAALSTTANYIVQRWVISLRYALSEEMEFTTRHAAVRSLASFKYVLKRSDATVQKSPIFLELYVLLYDMLNDDDAEIRNLAAETTSWVLSGSISLPQKNMIYNPLRAASCLVDFIADRYSSSPELCQIATRRILGQGYTGSRDNVIQVRAVRDTIRESQRDNTILFETEKQNLFINEIREVDNWMRALLLLKESAFEAPLLRGIFQWVYEGLEYLVEKSCSGEEDGPLGWTSKPEIYVVGMQVISVAGLFVSATSPVQARLPHEKEMISLQLNSLLKYGTAIFIHPHWLSEVESVLSSG